MTEAEKQAAAPSHERLIERVQGYASSAIRDSLREAIRTATRRRLNDDEAFLFQVMLGELEERGRKPAAEDRRIVVYGERGEIVMDLHPHFCTPGSVTRWSLPVTVSRIEVLNADA